MRVDRLTFARFRNLAAGELLPSPGVNIICGENGQGKTNLLEAIWLFTGAKSFRSAKDGELIAFGQQRTELALHFYSRGRDQTARIGLGSGPQVKPGEKKQSFLNDIPNPSVTAFAGVFCAVAFSPSTMGLIQNGPADRRRFLDTSICQILPRYIDQLRAFTRALDQRNALLKDIPRAPVLLDTLDVWDQHLARASAAVIRARSRYSRRLAEAGAEVYAGLSGGRERFSACYQTVWEPTRPLPSPGGPAEPALPDSLSALEEGLLELYRQNRRADVEAGVTTQGPHRDELLVTLDGVSARSYGSQGQQRSCVLALKLAESTLLTELNGEPPVILLDDVMSELDNARRSYILNHLSGKQVFITCCDEGYFRALKEGRIFQMKGGKLTHVSPPGE